MSKDVVEHYKKKLVKNLEDSDKVLHCLKKLEAVPVTIEILTQTEVGKVVNRLKKNPDATKDVIKASKALVEKWKDLVKTTEENESKEGNTSKNYIWKNLFIERYRRPEVDYVSINFLISNVFCNITYLNNFHSSNAVIARIV